MRNRRLMILVAATAIVAGLLGGGYVWRQQELNARALAARDRGLEASEAGDHLTALDQLGRYLQRYGQENDPETLYRYADARSRIPMPNGKHIQQAIGLMRLATERMPGLEAAERRLLELYLEAGFGQETLTLAAKMRAQRPDDADALRAEAVTLTRLQRYEEALACAQTLAAADPGDIQNQLLTLSLLQRTGESNDALLAYAEAQFQAAPGDVRMEVVRSVAHEMTGNRAEAAAAAERAAENPGGDALFIGTLEKLLDRLGRYDASLKLLERTAATLDEPALARSYTQRLYERGAYSALVEFAGSVALADRDSTVLAFQAMAHAQMDGADECAAVTAELEGRSGDAEAENWGPVLRAVFVDRSRAPGDIVEVCRAALIRNNDNPHFHHIMALAYERLGESSQAVSSWQSAIRLAPAWNEPILRTAAALSIMGRREEATRFALEALNRAPDNPVSAAKAAVIIGADLDALAPGNEARLFELVEKIQAAIPIEPVTLALSVELLCRAGSRDAAAARTDEALKAAGGMPAGVMLQLARVCERHDLEAAAACYAAVESSAEAGPDLAFARAAALREAGDPGAGRKLIEEAAQNAGGGGAWDLVLARYLDSVGAEDASSAWARAADGAADNPAIQKLALASNGAWNDRELVERAIERLQAATGDEGITWREAKARWLLASDTSEKAAAEASVLLNDVLRTAIPRAQHYTLMATALERLGNPRGAVENLEKALELEPESNGVLIELARLSLLRGERGRSVEYLAEVLRSGPLTESETRRAAAMLSAQGDDARAAELLLAVSDAESKPADLLLAQIHKQSGALAEAEAVARNLLAAGPSPQAIAFLADLLASQGRRDDARAELAALDGLSLDPGARDFIRAEHERRHGDAAETEALYRTAATAPGANAAIWRRYIGFVAARGRIVDAATLLAEAKAACPADAALAELAAQDALIRAVAEHPLAPAFVASAIEAPGALADAAPVLEALRDVPASDPEALAVQFKQLVDRSPRYLPLQVHLVRLYGSMGRHQEAASLASQAMGAFPASAEPAQLAAEAHAAAADWSEALSAATEWRRRSANRTIAADSMIAEAQIRLDRAPEALDTIRPYIENGSDEADAYSPLHVQHIQALVGASSIDEAEALIEARIAESADWRMAAVRIAAANIDSVDDAVRWLEKTEAAIPPDAEEERTTLASAWFALAERHGEAEYRGRARALLAGLAEAPGAGVRTLLTLAIVADRDGDIATAESHYRRALERDPGQSVAQNNLAMLLVTHNGDIQEAIRLATQAVESNPNNASYRDTLAHASAAAGDFDTALANLDRASALEPGETKWIDRREAVAQRQREAGSDATPSS